jgi:hypothetical protein
MIIVLGFARPIVYVLRGTTHGQRFSMIIDE